VETISVSPQKSQLVEERQFAVEEICRWFGVPPHKVQHLLRSTFSNIEHQSIEFVRDALTPWCVRLEQEADFKLFRQDRAPFKDTKIDLGAAHLRRRELARERARGLAAERDPVRERDSPPRGPERHRPGRRRPPGPGEPHDRRGGRIADEVADPRRRARGKRAEV
jgi:HK97 family phage portal protein